MRHFDSFVLTTCLMVSSTTYAGMGAAVNETRGVESKATESVFNELIGYGDSPVSEIKSLLKEDNVDGAIESYIANKDWFSEHGDRHSSLLDKLSEAYNASITPKIANADQSLNAITWPAVHTEWHSIKNTIDSVNQLIYEIQEADIYNDSRRPPKEYENLETKLNTLSSKIGDDAASMFSSYPIGSSLQDFSEIYPSDINAYTFFDENSKTFSRLLTGEKPHIIKTTFDLYSNYIDDELKAEFGSKYYDAILKAQTLPSEISLESMISAAAKTREAGMILEKVPDSKIALIEITSKTLLNEGQIEFPVSIDVDLPFNAEKSDFDSAFDKPIATSADMLILIDVAVARTIHEIVGHENIRSEYQSGTSSEANPDYAMAQNKINNARLAVSQATMNKAVTDSQYCYGSGCWGKLIGQIAAGVRVSSAQKDLEATMNELSNTSITNEKAVYTPYEFQKAKLNTVKASTVNYYVINRIDNKYFKGTFDAKQKQTFNVVYNLHENDRNKYSHLANAQSQEDIENYEDEAIEVQLSDVINHYQNNKDQSVPLPNVSVIKKQILADKNKTLTAYKEKQFTSKPINDKRFNSVVVIFHPAGGIGSGYYVRDDLVLTNYHVIEGTKYVEMKLFDGQETFGKVFAHDIRLDLALIKVQSRGNPVTFYNRADLPLGETVEAIGHPSGLEFSISRGVVSGLRMIESRYMQGGNKVRFIQTDVAINPGNSGGPLFYKDKVVGVNTQKLAATELEGLAFSIHYSEVIDFLERSGITFSQR